MKFAKNILVILILAILLLGIAGCGDDESAALIDPGDPVKVEDIDWIVENCIFEDEASLSFNYTNNSPYIITSVDMTFTPKTDVTSEQLDIFSNVTDDVSDVYILGCNRKFSDPGETVTDSPCFINGTNTLVENMEQFGLMEPSSVTITYIGFDNLMRAVYYDYKTQTVSEYGESLTLYNWSDGDLAKLVPKPAERVVRVRTDDEDKFRFTIYDCSRERFEEYVQECKDAGFTEDFSSRTNSYSAKSTNGFELELRYYYVEETISVKIEPLEDE